MLAVPPLFGRFLAKTGKVGEEHIRGAIQFQLELSGSLLEALVVEGALTPDQARSVKKHQRERGAHIEAAILELGLIDSDALAAFKGRHERGLMPLGEALVLRGAISEEQLAAFLTEFARYKEG